MNSWFSRFYLRPAHAIAFGYLAYILIGSFLLFLPISQKQSTDFLNHLFVASSAVSTTGLSTVDPGSTYNWFGQLIIFILFQLGGIGYMTASSFLLLAANRKISQKRVSLFKAAFSLPKSIGVAHLLKNIIVFTFVSELVGAIVLYYYFSSLNLPNALWSALFHSVSAFCTAGFSLYATGFESFRDHMGINICIAVLSYLGGVGFIVLTDFWEFLRGKRAQITFTTKVILSFSVLVSVLGTVSIYFLEPSIQTLNAEQKWMVAFFQAMSASTTVGFNTISISSLSLPVVMILYFLMFFGASPAGTGGGLKSTTLSALLAEIWSQLRSYKNIQFFGREIPDWRVRAASTSASLYGIILGLGIFALTLAMPQASFDKIVFEAISALGTVGLSMGLSSELNAWGKLILIALMYIGRLGVISFGLLLVAPAADNQDSHNKAIEDLAI